MIKIYSQKDAAGLLATRKTDSNKRDFGYVALVGGSLKYSGAIRLSALSAAEAAQVSGAGVVTVAAPKEICPLIIPQILCETLMPLNEESFAETSRGRYVPLSEAFSKYDVICFGMGIGREPEVPRMLKDLLENFGGILVIDADGLWALTQLDKSILKLSKARIVLTPHYGEYKMLTAWNDALPLSERCILLLKGPNPERGETLITNGTTDILVNTGTSGMSKGGSGDVLSGIIGAMAGQFGKKNLTEAVALAAYINGLAGMNAAAENGVISMTPKDTAMEIKKVLSSLYA